MSSSNDTVHRTLVLPVLISTEPGVISVNPRWIVTGRNCASPLSCRTNTPHFSGVSDGDRQPRDRQLRLAPVGDRRLGNREPSINCR